MFIKEFLIDGEVFRWATLDRLHWWPLLTTEEMHANMESIQAQLQEDDEPEWGKPWSPEDDG